MGVPDPDSAVIMTKIVPFEKQEAKKASQESSKPIVTTTTVPKSEKKESSKEEVAANMLLPYYDGDGSKGFSYVDTSHSAHVFPIEDPHAQERGFVYAGDMDYDWDDTVVTQWGDSQMSNGKIPV